MRRVLFICKKGFSYSGYDRKFSGLFNSTKFVADAIKGPQGPSPREWIDTKLVQVIDNNCIDREVSQYRPDVVVIEALWVIPCKFEILKKLHPKVKWYVHLHSDVAFLSNEGIAIDWIAKYLIRGVKIISNSKELIKALEYSLPKEITFDAFYYLPNCYPTSFYNRKDRSPVWDVGCFGAIRPLKNQLIQAMAAIEYANKNNLVLHFHINSNRVEGGENILKNLRSLFKYSPHGLYEHEWSNHHDFVSLMRRMDLLLQVSFSETFNIVSADAVANGVPVVGSNEISWLSCRSKALCNEIESIVNTISNVMKSRTLLLINQIRLWSFVRGAKKKWVRFVLSTYEQKRFPV